MNDLSPFVRVAGVSRSFPVDGGRLEVLKGIDLEIGRGEMIAIVGASGVGKSTLLHIIGLLDRPTSGTVAVNGADCLSLPETQIAALRNRKIGFVFQFHHLLQDFTAIENVLMPARIGRENLGDYRKRAVEILTEVGLGKRLSHKPGALSGGEQQRVAIARAMILKPEIILADEPTGNLDTRASDDVFALLKDLNRRYGLTIVLVTHNERLSAQTHRIVRMVDGRIAEVRDMA